MEIIQFAFYGQEPAEVSELVYDSLHGHLLPACALPWVENIFVPGYPAYEAYDEMRRIRDHLYSRQGSGREDRE